MSLLQCIPSVHHFFEPSPDEVFSYLGTHQDITKGCQRPPDTAKASVKPGGLKIQNRETSMKNLPSQSLLICPISLWR